MVVQSLLPNILNATLNELYTLEFDHYEELYDYEKFYVKVLINYLKHDIHELERLCQTISEYGHDCKNFNWQIVYQLSSIRLSFRKQTIDPDELKGLEKLQNLYKLWKGESDFILGMAYADLKDYEKSSRHFYESFINLKRYKCFYKSLLALQNCFTSRINQTPEKIYISDWHFLYQKAKEKELPSIMGNALLNLSSQFQSIGSLKPALDNAFEALELFHSSVGTHQYYLCLAQIVDLLIDSNNRKEALPYFEKLKCSPFTEHWKIIDVLKSKLTKTEIDNNINISCVPWQERIDKLTADNALKLGNKSQELLSLLYQEERDKYELIDNLYPEDIPFEVKENRFKVLLSSTRKKLPGLIVLREGKYYLDMEDEWLIKKAL